jgi:hypothetical protein
MFRNSLEGNRDMYVVQSDDGGKTFGRVAKLGSGTWRLNACPMDGGALQFDSTGKAVSIWRREGEVFLSTGPSQEQRLGPGRQPILTATPRGPVLAWTEGKALKVLRPGQASAAILDSDAAFPSIVALPNGSVALAWEQKGAIVVRSLD